MKQKPPRKPRLDGWECFIDTIWKSGPGVMHKKSGRFWLGAKQLKKIGNFFLKASEYLEYQEQAK